MPAIERLTWPDLQVPSVEPRTVRDAGVRAIWGTMQQKLRRFFDVADASARMDAQVVSATATLALTYPRTLAQSDTTAGAVTLTLPSAASVPGFSVTNTKTAGGNTLTFNGITVTTFATFTSNGAAWVRTG